MFNYQSLVDIAQEEFTPGTGIALNDGFEIPIFAYSSNEEYGAKAGKEYLYMTTEDSFTRGQQPVEILVSDYNSKLSEGMIPALLYHPSKNIFANAPKKRKTSLVDRIQDLDIFNGAIKPSQEVSYDNGFIPLYKENQTLLVPVYNSELQEVAPEHVSLLKIEQKDDYWEVTAPSGETMPLENLEEELNLTPWFIEYEMDQEMQQTGQIFSPENYTVIPKVGNIILDILIPAISIGGTYAFLQSSNELATGAAVFTGIFSALWVGSRVVYHIKNR